VRINDIQTFAADGGFTTFHFLKITSDDGTVGWSEFGDGRPSPGGIGALIADMGQALIGRDPHRVRSLSADLYAKTRFAAGGTVTQAIAAIENACLDLAARDLGIPIRALLGGSLRDAVPVYWSHCGMFRAGRPQLAQQHGLRPIRTMDDFEQLGAEVRSLGFTAAKTNLFQFGEDGFRLHNPGFGEGGQGPALEATPRLIAETRAVLEALRRGAGDGVELMLDANFNLRVDGAVRLASAVEDVGLRWLEVDTLTPRSLAAIRRSVTTPLASLEAVLGIRDFSQYFLDGPAADVAVIDAMWNGLLTSLAMASIAEASEISIAPHVYGGPLATVMAAHLALMTPNVAIMEYDVDAAPWRDSFITSQPVIENGLYTPPDGPGWGCEIDEAVLVAHELK
jgi:galactonate dehydratase